MRRERRSGNIELHRPHDHLLILVNLLFTTLSLVQALPDIMAPEQRLTYRSDLKIFSDHIFYPETGLP